MNKPGTTKIEHRDTLATTVIALHCSGGSPSGWSTLAENIPVDCEISCPGHRFAGPTSAQELAGSYTINDEAAPIVELIDVQQKPVYLVGHSFGGALALRVAEARPSQVAGITLYEPCLFGILHNDDPQDKTALAEIIKLRNQVCNSLQLDNPDLAMEHFIDYWNGEGAWATLHPKAKQKIVEWAPNARDQFDVLFQYSTARLQALTMPVQLVIGENALQLPRAIADRLTRELPCVHLQTLADAAHMGPLTHAKPFANLVRNHIDCIYAPRSSTGCSHKAGSQPRVIANVLVA